MRTYDLISNLEKRAFILNRLKEISRIASNERRDLTETEKKEWGEGIEKCKLLKYELNRTIPDKGGLSLKYLSVVK